MEPCQRRYQLSFAQHSANGKSGWPEARTSSNGRPSIRRPPNQ